ncbi:hypothetical protein BVC80_9071g60 [Macleaya cordata]|uniref:Reverse transcriptase zinc-binding domain n=1 Tax=Macleaya cordata TaxID=56857 RepID=A0A200PU31_MACCD|nr:hypothetical protein BVC80_9071g60 [Macleaya cordata]
MVRHVLSSMAIYLLLAVVVPKVVLQRINRLISGFFWGSHDGKPKHNWVSWKAICRPVLEGGLGVRYIEDVEHLMQFKKTWQNRPKADPREKLGGQII